MLQQLAIIVCIAIAASAGDEQASPCASGTFLLANSECVDVTTCGECGQHQTTNGQYRVEIPGTEPCSEGKGRYIHADYPAYYPFEWAAPTPSTDRICAACSTSHYQLLAPTGSTDAVCEAITDCSANNEFLVVAPTPTTNAVCSSTPCTPVLVDMTSGGTIAPVREQAMYADDNGLYYNSQSYSLFGVRIWITQSFNEGTIGFYFFSVSGSTSTTIKFTVWDLSELPVGYDSSHPRKNIVAEKATTIEMNPKNATRVEVAFPGLLFQDVNTNNPYNQNVDDVAYFVQVQTSAPAMVAFKDSGASDKTAQIDVSGYPVWHYYTEYWSDESSYWQPINSLFVDLHNKCPSL